jgi:hypothetical protein
LQWTLAALAIVLTGVSKGGLSSASFATVPILAWVFGGKLSTGIVLPLLIIGDIMAVIYYKRLTHWHLLFRLLPSVVLGVLLGTWIGQHMDEFVFKKVMAAILFLSVGVLLYFERKPIKNISDAPAFSGIMGIGTGFTSMVGNQAGGVANLYFLSAHISKEYFIGTNAWLFMLVNSFKLPFHIFSWQTIKTDTLALDLALLPFVVLGFWLGVRVTKLISEDLFRKVIIGLTAIGTLFILFDF